MAGYDQIAVSIVAETQARCPALRAISMDKGFHRPRNQTELEGMLERVVLPNVGGGRIQRIVGE